MKVVSSNEAKMSNPNHNPVIPPRPDVSYVGVKPPPTPERTHSTRGSTRRDPPPVPPHPDGDWEAKEDIRIRELEEARARAAQMEKTMRWWSDCTANWREKWSKVRNERNKARDECRHLRSKLENSVKEVTVLKRERLELAAEAESLRKQSEAYQNSEKERASICSSGSHKSGISDLDAVAVAAPLTAENVQELNKATATTTSTAPPSDDFVSKLLSRKDNSKDVESSSSGQSDRSDKKRHRQDRRPQLEGSPTEDTLARQKLTMVQMKLDEAQKTIQGEREEKSGLAKTIDNLQEEMASLKTKCEDLKKAKQDVVEKLSTVQEQHDDEMGRMTSELEDESQSRSNMERQLCDLRKELEKLQGENAQEWGKRERLETEKLSLERESKKLRHQIEQLEEELDRKNRQATVAMDSDMRTLQMDLAEKQKELTDLRHLHSKLKKILQEKIGELEHACSRAEQYEQEVKKLRSRIEELKHDLAKAEDEVDQQTNRNRRIQRTNDELQQQVESLQVQVEHVQSRLRNSSSQPLLTTRSSSLKHFDPEPGEGPSDEDVDID